MELNEILNPWIQQMETSLKPYLQFVGQVAEAVSDLEPRVNEILRASNAQVATSAGVVSSAPTQQETRAPLEMFPVFPERHVLLVDDAEINRVLMSHYFKGLPVKLEFAVSVEVALQKCQSRRFDLIVIDDELQDLENPILRSSSNQIVGLSNRADVNALPARFEHILSRGQAREAFIERLKAFLWDAERVA